MRKKKEADLERRKLHLQFYWLLENDQNTFEKSKIKTKE